MGKKETPTLKIVFLGLSDIIGYEDMKLKLPRQHVHLSFSFFFYLGHFSVSVVKNPVLLKNRLPQSCFLVDIETFFETNSLKHM